MQCDEPVVKPTPPAVRLRPIALPVEHGGWGLLIAPLITGLWLAPSPAGGWLSLAALGAFLTRQPLKLAVGDRLRRKRYPRTVWAERFAIGYSLIALLGLIGAILTATSPFWLPLALAAPFATLQISYDLRRQSRELLAELSGAIAINGLAPALMLAAGWPLWSALLVWGLLGLQAVAAIIYVRARLRLARNEPVRRGPPLLLHLGALALAGELVAAGWIGWPVFIVFFIVLLRCWFGLLPRSLTTPTPLVGAQEVLVSLITVVGIVVGMAR